MGSLRSKGIDDEPPEACPDKGKSAGLPPATVGGGEMVVFVTCAARVYQR